MRKLIGTRKEQIVLLTRLRIGHIRLTHEHIFTKEDPENCTNCNVPLIVQHLTEFRILVNEKRTFNIPRGSSERLEN